MQIQIKNIEFKNPATGKNLFLIPELQISSGQHILIRGPSGCGKSSFLNLLAGLIQANSGDIILDGVHLAQTHDQQRSDLRCHNMSFIFQRLNLLPHLTVFENLQLGQMNVQKLNPIDDVLKQFKLEELKNQRCGQLSLGQQQKVAIARSAVKQVQLILADEPTSSLDHESTDLIMSALIETAKNKTLICVSHDERVESFFKHKINFTDWSCG